MCYYWIEPLPYSKSDKKRVDHSTKPDKNAAQDPLGKKDMLQCSENDICCEQFFSLQKTFVLTLFSKH